MEPSPGEVAVMTGGLIAEAGLGELPVTRPAPVAQALMAAVEATTVGLTCIAGIVARRLGPCSHMPPLAQALSAEVKVMTLGLT